MKANSAVGRRLKTVLGLALLLGSSSTLLASGKGEDSDIEIGGPGNGNGKFNRLADLTFDNKGVLYVLDSGTTDTADREFAGNMVVQKFDGDTGQFIGQISIREQELGDLDQPQRLAVDDRATCI